MANLPNWTSDKDRLFCDGKPVTIRGVNYFGFETETLCPHGLWNVSLDSVLDFVKSSGFNALRVPFSLDFALNMKAMPTSINYAANPGLRDKTAGQVMDVLVQECAERGLLVMPDLHRIRKDGGIPEVMWLETKEQDLHTAWTNVVNRYKGAWNVFAADLVNEPHGRATWGTGNETDWRLAAERLGATVLKANPRLLVFVEGVDKSQSGHDAFWGGSIESCITAPVRLPVPKKLVYSPHVYGPDVFMQKYFSADNFPDNMPTIWEAHFGFAVARQDAAVVPGEFGGKAKSGSPDLRWQQRIVQWFRSKNMSTFYWCVNPNSGDTNGLLMEDWKSPDNAKLALLRTLPAPTTFTGKGATVSPGANPDTGDKTDDEPPEVGKGVSTAVKVDNKWTDSGATVYQYTAELVNNTSVTVKDLRFRVRVDSKTPIRQFWAMEQAAGSSGGVYRLPKWLQDNGGLAPGARLVVGFITADATVSLARP
jgi:endoglucanase